MSEQLDISEQCDRISQTANDATVRSIFALSEDIFVLRVRNPRWMSFSTNHTQNVIDKIIVTADLKEAAALAPQYIRELLSRRNLTIPGQIYTIRPLQAIYITPTSGPALTCIADGVTGDN
jgi:hypothetical protein